MGARSVWHRRVILSAGEAGVERIPYRLAQGFGHSNGRIAPLPWARGSSWAPKPWRRRRTARNAEVSAPDPSLASVDRRRRVPPRPALSWPRGPCGTTCPDLSRPVPSNAEGAKSRELACPEGTRRTEWASRLHSLLGSPKARGRTESRIVRFKEAVQFVARITHHLWLRLLTPRTGRCTIPVLLRQVSLRWDLVRWGQRPARPCRDSAVHSNSVISGVHARLGEVHAREHRLPRPR